MPDILTYNGKAKMFLCLKKCLLAYSSMQNLFFMDLPVSSFVFYSFLAGSKSVKLLIARDGFLS